MKQLQLNDVLIEMNPTDATVYNLPRIVEWLQTKNFNISWKWKGLDTYIRVEGFGSGGVCVNDIHNFYDISLFSEDLDKLQKDLEKVFEPYSNVVEYQNWSSFIRMWLYWDKFK